jgi:tetratricopeptide (TPR) repeat protein
MNKILMVVVVFCVYINGISQNSDTIKSENNKLLVELSENACKCIDSILVENKSVEDVSKEIHRCINEQVGAYQVGVKMMNIADLVEVAKEDDGKKEINIEINMDVNSQEYQKYYFELERYLMENCVSMKEKVASNNKVSEKSMTKNPRAKELYSQGIIAVEKENYKKAIEYFEAAVKIDPEFAFAWDNLGLSYRRLNNYDKAIYAYEKSLKIDPNGTMPLQNIAIVYQYKQEFKKAIKAYKKLAEVDKDNPEVYYGIGQIYASNLNDLEKGLDYICKAYNLYVNQKSPYRTDAEKLINMIYVEMKKQGKVDKFKEILNSNNITPNEK